MGQPYPELVLDVTVRVDAPVNVAVGGQVLRLVV